MCKKCLYLLTVFLLIAVAFLPTEYVTAEDPEVITWRDDFEGTLGEGWSWQNENLSKWSLTENPGFLRIYTAFGGTGSENFLYRAAPEGDFAIETHLLFEPSSNFQFAGLVIYMDDGNRLQLGRAFCDVPEACVGNGIYFDYHLGDDNFATEIGNMDEVYLRMERHGDMIKGFYGYDGMTWFEIGTHWLVEGFTINYVGLTSAQNTAPVNIPADFDYFVLTEGFPAFPSQFIWVDPYHDVINAWGWEEDEEISIQILDAEGGHVYPEPASLIYHGGAVWELRDQGIDLQGGYIIEMSGDISGITKTLVVSPLDVQAYDFNQNTISGIYDPVLPININLWGFTVFGFSTGDGNWAATFSEMPYGAGGEVWQTDEDGDMTGIGMWVPSPRLTVSITDDWLRVEDFPRKADVLVSIYNYPGDLEPWQEGRTTDENGFLFVGGWEIERDFVPGMVVEVSHDLVTKSIELEPLTMYVVDEDNNYLAGKALPERDLWVGAGNEIEGNSMEVTSSTGEFLGFWEADFDDIGFDIQEGMWKAVQALDEDGDATEANPGFPRGSHDYDNGDVPYWACNVGGWVVDPDDQTREVLIRIWADDEIVYPENTTDHGFEAHFWDVISSYETHIMLVEAFDVESDAWYPLENSPRELTCRTQDIYYFDPDTGETHQVTDLRDTNEYNPSWSPIGRFVVYDVTPLDHSSSYLSITDSYTGFTYPLYGTDGGNDAIWSANGLSLIFDRHTAGDDSLYEIPVIGGRRKLIKQDAISADLSPDGKYLVYQQPSDGSLRILSLVGKVKDAFLVDFGEHPVWSPDGNWIAYQRDGEIWKIRVNPTGKPMGDPVQVTASPFWKGMPTWSADSQFIIYHAGLGRDYDLWKVSAGGGLPEWLTGALEFGDYDPSSAKHSDKVAYSSFSPNGQAGRTWVAAFTHDMDGLDPGDHTYYFTGGEETSEEIGVTVIEETTTYDGYVLFRPNGLVARIGEDKYDLETPIIHPDQGLRFMIGWTAEGSYLDVLNYYDILQPKAYLDGEEFLLFRHEVFPFSSDIDWGQYVFSFTW